MDQLTRRIFAMFTLGIPYKNEIPPFYTLCRCMPNVKIAKIVCHTPAGVGTVLIGRPPNS